MPRHIFKPLSFHIFVCNYRLNSQTITDMLETYHYEMAILSTANHLLSTDTFKSMRAYVRRRCKGVRVSLPSDVSAASVEALEVMPSGNVVVQVEPRCFLPCVYLDVFCCAANRTDNFVVLESSSLSALGALCFAQRSRGKATTGTLQQVLQNGACAGVVRSLCLSSIFVSCDPGHGLQSRSFLQIGEEKTGITLLKRLSHGGLDATAAVVDVSTIPLCCDSVAGKQHPILHPAFNSSSAHTQVLSCTCFGPQPRCLPTNCAKHSRSWRRFLVRGCRQCVCALPLVLTDIVFRWDSVNDASADNFQEF